jgi:hypothetical protein
MAASSSAVVSVTGREPPSGRLVAAVRTLALAQMDCSIALLLALHMQNTGSTAEAKEALRAAEAAFEQAREAFDMITA